MSDPSLLAARIAAHHAAQVVSAWGATHLPPDDDHQYANLGWDPRLSALVGRSAHGLAAALRLSPPTWMLVRGAEVVAERPVAGATIDEGLAWFREQGARVGAPDEALAPVGYELPDHPVAQGEAFPAPSAEAWAVLSRWFDTAHTVVSEIVARESHASAPRCWPHHFDLATLISLDPEEEDAEVARSVGVGMTPGDGGIEEPYYYVTPWPKPEPLRAPDLPHGHWHTEGWFGAVLPASEWDGQRETLRRTLDAAVRASRVMLGS